MPVKKSRNKKYNLKMFSIIDENSGEFDSKLTAIDFRVSTLLQCCQLLDENSMEKRSAAASRNSKSVKRRVFADIPTNVEIPLQSATRPKFKLIDPDEHETTSIDESALTAGRADETFVKVWRTPVRKSQSLQLPSTQQSSPSASKQKKVDKSPAISSNYAKFMAANSEQFINNQLLPLPTAEYLNRSTWGAEDSPAVVCESREELDEAFVPREVELISDTFIIAPRAVDTTRIIATSLEQQLNEYEAVDKTHIKVAIVVQVVIVLILLLILFYFI